MNLIPHLIHVYGLVVVAVIVGIECVGFPLPGETALLAAAIDAATKHDLNIDAVILTATGAAVVGRTVGYLIGRKFGYRLLLHYKNHLGLTEGRIKLGQYLFLKHGGKIIFVAQFAPVLRAFAGLLAGANVMPWRKFMLANVASSGVWAMIYGYAAYWIGHEFKQMQSQVAIFLVIIILVILIVFGIFVHRYEAQLVARAERAMPGPLRLR
ncbi:MAG: DedA family protein [Xanthobacteraceae bacterium]